MRITSRTEARCINVLVTDGDALTARLLTSHLRRQRQFHIIECAPGLASILECVAKTAPDVVLLSANSRDGAANTLPLLKRIRRQCPQTRAIVLVESLERQFVAELFRAGAKGVFDRSEYDPKSLSRCIRCVAGGQVWANSEQIESVLEVFAETASLRIVTKEGRDLLTRRELDVVRLVAEGCGNREIAQQLGLSEHTVKNYLFNIFDKLGISSRAELVIYALSNSDNKRQLQGSESELRPAAMPIDKHAKHHAENENHLHRQIIVLKD